MRSRSFEAAVGVEDLAHARAFPRDSPSRPVGRNIRTTTRTTKAVTLAQLELQMVRGVDLDDAEQQAADEGAAQVADAAEDGGGERLEPDDEADVELRDVVLDRVEQRRHTGHGATEDEDQHDDAVLVDAHEGGGVGVLGHGADAAAEAALVHEGVQRHHHHDRAHDDDHAGVGDREVEAGMVKSSLVWSTDGMSTVTRPNGGPKKTLNTWPKISTSTSEQPMPVIRKISGGAPFLRSGR